MIILNLKHVFAFSLIIFFGLLFSISSFLLLSFAIGEYELFDIFAQGHRDILLTISSITFFSAPGFALIVFGVAFHKEKSKRKALSLKTIQEITERQNELKELKGLELYKIFFKYAPNALPTVEECYEIIKYHFVQYKIFLAQSSNLFDDPTTLRSLYDSHAPTIDEMTGEEFEQLCVKILHSMGYSDISTTKTTGDQGVDILAHKNGVLYAVQCKRYSSSVGNDAIQQVYAGAAYYGASKKIVMSNSYFTKSAVQLAEKIGVDLIDGDVVSRYRENHVPAISLKTVDTKAIKEKASREFDEMSPEEKEKVMLERMVDNPPKVTTMVELIAYTENLLKTYGIKH